MAKNSHFRHLLKFCLFSKNSCFLNLFFAWNMAKVILRPLKHFTPSLQLFFVRFQLFEFFPENWPFFTILPCYSLREIAKYKHFLHLSKSCFFSKIRCFLNLFFAWNIAKVILRPLKRLTPSLELFFVRFQRFDFFPENWPFFTILPCFCLSKMAKNKYFRYLSK